MDTLVINLDAGKITGKSKLNFRTFVAILDSNTKHSLLLEMAASVGLNLEATSPRAIEFSTENEALFENFSLWLKERQDYILSKKINNNKVLVSAGSI